MIVIINGAPCAGKDLFCRLTEGIIGESYCHSISSVDYVKKIAVHCGWDGYKDLKGRALLSGLKALLTDYNDGPMQYTLHTINTIIRRHTIYDIPSDSYIIFVHIREPEQIRRLQEITKAYTLLIRRDTAESAPSSNSSDENVLNYNYDFEIENNSTIEDLRKEVIKFLEQLKNKTKER